MILLRFMAGGDAGLEVIRVWVGFPGASLSQGLHFTTPTEEISVSTWPSLLAPSPRACLDRVFSTYSDNSASED